MYGVVITKASEIRRAYSFEDEDEAFEFYWRFNEHFEGSDQKAHMTEIHSQAVWNLLDTPELSSL